MNRRGFFRLLLASGSAALLDGLPGRRSWAKPPPGPAALPDLVAVKDGSPVQMFEAGIEALGGMKRFVKKGTLVLVKPNIGWDKTPIEGADTNPDLVGRVVRAAYDAGAREVAVCDHSVETEKSCYERSGIEKAVRDNQGVMHTASRRSDYRKVPVPGGKVLKEVEVHRLYLDSDVVINVPILKSHGGGRMTASLKNLMGVVWDRSYWHRHGLHQAIAEFPLVRKPDLNVVDAYIVMMENGPRGVSSEDLLLKRMQVLSPDPVLADTACARMLDMKPEDVSYLPLAQALGLGSMDLAKRSIRRISVAG
ncbi:MAG: hypothetical protein A2X36_11235 [Elusimicrobia bacterium GWA2_69_24]|nr:MAG: hypothetical protein A2X36_11235 [Elusimicrobia bacterium GWA2_69_24]HBL18091.1 tat (twin-arginine translocation) pathway signal sequence [Elusimicrobiota bacterium]